MSTVNLKQLLRSKLRDSGVSEIFKQDNFSYQGIFLNKIKPDPTNARYFPCKVISDNHASQFTRRFLNKREMMELYQGQGHVLVGKKCFINCTKYGSKEWKMIEENIENIVSLAEHIERSEVIQVPTIYPDLTNDEYIVVTGHRRFFAMLYTHGADGVGQFKVYDKPPLLKKTKQFQENAAREDLPQSGKLKAFLNAKEEVSMVSQASLEMGKKKLTVREFANILGISNGAYDNYNVLTRYASVVSAYENGLSTPFVKVKKLILETEAQYKTEHNVQEIGGEGRNRINRQLKHLLAGEVPEQAVKPKPFKIKSITNENVLKTLLTKDITSLDTGIDWQSLDWSNQKEVNEQLNQLIDFLESSCTTEDK